MWVEILVCLLTFVFWLRLWWFRKRRFWDELGVVTAPGERTILGNSPRALQLQGRGRSLLETSLEQYREMMGNDEHRFYGAYFLREPVLVVTDPDLAGQILGDTENCYPRDEEDSCPMERDPEKNSVTMQMLSDAMKRYGGTLEQLLLRTMVKSGVVEEDTLRDALEDAIEDTEGEFDASELSEKFCLMSVGQSLLGLEMEEDQQEFFQLVQSHLERKGGNAFTLPFLLLSSIPFLKSIFEGLKAIPLFSPRIKQYMKDFHHSRKPGLLKHLLKSEETPGGNPSHQLEEQLLPQMISGCGTTATALTAALFELAGNRAVQEKLRHEIDQHLVDGDAKDYHEAIPGMSYLEMVTLEVLRRYPRHCITSRFTRGAFPIPGSSSGSGVTIPPGTEIQIHTAGIHLDPKYYPEPEKFNPENFEPETRLKRNKNTFLSEESPSSGICCLASAFAKLQLKIALVQIVGKFVIDEKLSESQSESALDHEPPVRLRAKPRFEE